jgi:hypothetical protein
MKNPPRRGTQNTLPCCCHTENHDDPRTPAERAAAGARAAIGQIGISQPRRDGTATHPGQSRKADLEQACPSYHAGHQRFRPFRSYAPDHVPAPLRRTRVRPRFELPALSWRSTICGSDLCFSASPFRNAECRPLRQFQGRSPQDRSNHPLSGRVTTTSDRVVVPDPWLGSSARADARGIRYRAPPVWRVPLRRIERRCCYSLPFEQSGVVHPYTIPTTQRNGPD